MARTFLEGHKEVTHACSQWTLKGSPSRDFSPHAVRRLHGGRSPEDVKSDLRARGAILGSDAQSIQGDGRLNGSSLYHPIISTEANTLGSARGIELSAGLSVTLVLKVVKPLEITEARKGASDQSNEVGGSKSPEDLICSSVTSRSSHLEPLLVRDGVEKEASSLEQMVTKVPTDCNVSVKELSHSSEKLGTGSSTLERMQPEFNMAPRTHRNSPQHEDKGLMLVEDFYLSCGDEFISLMELRISGGGVLSRSSRTGVVYLRGITDNGLRDVACIVNLWRLQFTAEGKPKFLVQEVAGSWMELQNCHVTYLSFMRTVKVAAHFLAFTKQQPTGSKEAAWRYVCRECSSFEAKPNQDDLSQAFPLIQAIVSSDQKLEIAPIIRIFFPTLYKGETSRAEKTSLLYSGVAMGTTETGRTRPQKRLRKIGSLYPEVELPFSQNCKAEPFTNEVRCKVDKKDRCNQENHSSNSKFEDREGVEEWVDEPDVCAFCDDGVDAGEKLLCCDGPCMRSFHPTTKSGRKNECVSLGLTKAAVEGDGYVCPNCKCKRQQCFSCNLLGSSHDSLGAQEVFVCGARACRRFYHPQCVAKLLVSKPMQEAFALGIQRGLEKFRCPLHKCFKCGLEENKDVRALHLVKCRRCPVAWHDMCLPDDCCTWPVDGGKVVMYCGKHILDPRLLTPRRNHIIFPSEDAPSKVDSLTKSHGFSGEVGRLTAGSLSLPGYCPPAGADPWLA